MNLFLKLGQKITECKKHLFYQGYSLQEADNFVRITFEETGLKFGVFDYVEKEELKNAIKHLQSEILES